ncbi:MAG: zinc metalloprotease [Reichenbachiella sp.]|uniref:zinc metalloprotease n=1 Tax=Reichenbachiella sp. TaxID=2184521 RepID=UPI0032967CE6
MILSFIQRFLLASVAIFLLLANAFGRQQINGRTCKTIPAIESKTTFRIEEDSESIYVIPVVFHVVYHTDLQNISDQQIWSQLSVLNNDFRRYNADASNTDEEFKPLATDAKLTFVLADVDPGNRPTDGITRTKTESTVFSNNDLHDSSAGGVDGWDPTKYLNIWIAPLAPGLLGYASSVGVSSQFDGIAIHYENVGEEGTAKEPYHLGRTLTHEMGHYLGMSHLWGNGGCESDDGIVDTPLQDKALAGCDVDQSSCDSKDMVQNFMNLADDDCLNFFTIGQVRVMRSMLTQYKPQLFRKATVLNVKNELSGLGKIRFYQKGQGVNEIYLENITSTGELILVNSAGRILFSRTVNQPELPILADGQWSVGLYIAYYQTQYQVYATKFILKE